MPKKSFRGKSMRPERGVVVDTETIVKYRKKAKPGKRMVFGSIRAQKEMERKKAEEVQLARQKTIDDYALVQKTLDEFKRYPGKKKFRKEKSREKKIEEEAEELIEAVREEMEKPGAVRIREPWKEESVPYKIKKKMQKEFPAAMEKLGKVEAVKKSEEMAATAYGKVFKEEKKKKAKSTIGIVEWPLDTADVLKLMGLLFGLIILIGLLAWLASVL